MAASAEVSAAARALAAEALPFVTAAAERATWVAEDLAAVRTFEDLELAAGRMAGASTVASEVANMLADSVYVHEVRTVADVERLLQTNGNNRFLRVVLSGIPNLHEASIIISKFAHRAGWDVANIQMLGHVDIITRELKKVVDGISDKGTNPKCLPLPRSLLSKRTLFTKEKQKKLRRVVQVLRDNGPESGLDFWRIAGEVEAKLTAFLEDPDARTAADFIELRIYIIGVLESPVEFVL